LTDALKNPIAGKAELPNIRNARNWHLDPLTGKARS
jgi:hypothetical protein